MPPFSAFLPLFSRAGTMYPTVHGSRLSRIGRRSPRRAGRAAGTKLPGSASVSEAFQRPQFTCGCSGVALPLAVSVQRLRIRRAEMGLVLLDSVEYFMSEML